MSSIIPNREIVANVKRRFPAGCRVRLVRMGDDPRPVPEGTCGTVQAVDDLATIHVAWDNGRSLGAIFGEDLVVRIDG